MPRYVVFSVLRTSGGGQQVAGGAKKTARFSEIVAVKEVVYETGDNFGDPFLGDSLGGSAVLAGVHVEMQMQHPHQQGQQAHLRAEQCSVVCNESSARWHEMESDASGIWRFAQLRAERWRAEDDARRLRAQVEQLQWQIELCRAALQETAAALDNYELEPPKELCHARSTYAEQLLGVSDGSPFTPEGTAVALNHSEVDPGTSGDNDGIKSPRAAAAAAAAARGILSQTSRTPWLRTPDGVPVRIDWLVLAPRVLTALGIWLGLSALVMRATNRSPK